MNGESITGSFYEQELQNSSQVKFRMEKVIKKEVRNCTFNGKDMTIDLIVGLIKKILYQNHLEVLEETLMLKLIFLIMQQKLIYTR